MACFRILLDPHKWKAHDTPHFDLAQIAVATFSKKVCHNAK